MIKAIVMDMDGTLLNEKNRISPETKKALIDLEKKGVRLILASGRSYTRLLKYAHELEMDKYGGFLIEIDGVAVYEVKTQKREKLKTMGADEIHDVFSWLMESGAEPQAMFDDGAYVFIPERARKIKEKLRKERNLPDDYPWTAGPWDWLTDYRDGYPKITYINSADEIRGPINKLQIMDDEDPISQVYSGLMDRFGDEFAIYRTTPRQLEVLPYGFSKGNTLKKLMEDEGWKPDEVAAFGDGENDVSLFEACDHSFAMGNAADFVKQRAKDVTGSNRENGIVQALVKLDLPK